MARKILTNLDLNWNQLLNTKLQLLASDPASPGNGDVWINTTTWVLKVHLNGATISLGRLDQISLPTGSLDLNSQKIINLGAPTNPDDAVTKAYADNIAASLSPKDSVRVASTANVDIATGLANGAVLDGVTLATGDRVLLKDQATASQNGIYVVPASGAASRAGDADTADDIRGMFTLVEEGTAAGEIWILVTDPPITLGTTALTFGKFSVGANVGTVVKYAADIGDGTSTSIPVAHNLNTLDVLVSVHQISNGAEVYPDVVKTNANTVTLGFTIAPTANSLRVIVLG